MIGVLTYLNTWVINEYGDVVNNDGETVVPCNEKNTVRYELEFICAAPDMCRVLLELEWSSPSGSFECPACQRWSTYEHETTCSLDAALTKAGLPDQFSRDEARKRINEGK